jgi:hypothetical protein
MDFIGFSFKIFEVISPYQLTMTFFNMGFHLVLKGFMSEIIVVKDYSNEILNFKTISIRIIYIKTC